MAAAQCRGDNLQNVAITGLGVISSIAMGTSAYWDALVSGKRAFSPAPIQVDSGAPRFWAAVPDAYLANPGVPAEMLRNADRFTQYAIIAAAEAIAMSGLDMPQPGTAVVMGTTMGGVPLLAETQMQFATHPHRVTPKLMALIIPNMAAARISLNWGLRGRQLTISTACASSLDAIGLAAQMIERGEADFAIAGGAESLLAPVVYQSLDRAGALSRSADPSTASRPFDVERDGFVMGDGGAVLFLEKLQSAQARGARVLGRVRGYASMTDAYHLTAPEPSGRYEAEVMQAALEDARCSVDVIFAHATSTVVGDLAELRAINRCFPGVRPVVTTPRGHLGHAMAASGAMSVVAGILGMWNDAVPCTLGTRTVEPEARFDVVLHEARTLRYQVFSVNAFGFGGQNASIVVSR
ncbi:MAG: beta-ketoacyl-[acyl-carrier-protein] synthase family protein [Acetobacteraceae bacterium]